MSKLKIFSLFIILISVAAAGCTSRKISDDNLQTTHIISDHSDSGQTDPQENPVLTDDNDQETNQDDIGNNIYSVEEIRNLPGMYVISGSQAVEVSDGEMPWLMRENERYACNVLFGMYSVAMIQPDREQVVQVKQGDTVAVVTQEDYKKVHIYPVKETGYTVPAKFSHKGMNILGDYGLQSNGAVDEIFRPIDDVNGTDYETFCENSLFDPHTKYSHPEEMDIGYNILDAQKDESYTFGWYEGTSYQSETLSANCQYFVYDMNEDTETELQLTHDGYAVIDVSGLEQGIYTVICAGKSNARYGGAITFHYLIEIVK